MRKTNPIASLHGAVLNMRAVKPQMFGALCAVLAILIWSWNFIAGRVLIDSIHPMTLAAVRCCLVSLCMFPVILPRLKREWPILRAHALFIVCAAVLGISLPNTFIYVAARHAQAINLSIISLTSPIFVLILARIFFSEYLTINRLTGVFLALLGMLVLLSKGDPSLLLHLNLQKGDLLMFGNTVPFAVYTILVRKLPAGISYLTFMFLLMFVGGLAVAPGAIWEICTGNAVVLSTRLFFWLLYVSLGASFLGYALWNLGVAYAGAARASLISYLSPVFCGLEAFLLLNEPITLAHVLSMFMIVIGTFVAAHTRRLPTRR
jgi:drug/metabolite transporter (DMT)-like permease